MVKSSVRKPLQKSETDSTILTLHCSCRASQIISFRRNILKRRCFYYRNVQSTSVRPCRTPRLTPNVRITGTLRPLKSFLLGYCVIFIRLPLTNRPISAPAALSRPAWKLSWLLKILRSIIPDRYRALRVIVCWDDTYSRISSWTLHFSRKISRRSYLCRV